MPWIIPLLAVAVLSLAWLRWKVGRIVQLWRGEDSGTERKHIRYILNRWMYSSAVMLLAVILFLPDQLFFLPSQKPELWALILLIYPPLLVVPQEIIYRVFMFHRYAAIFPTKFAYSGASAFAFGWLHLLFGNAVAIVSSVLGGWFFADTYVRTQSLRLVCLEHALYGMTIFSIGLPSSG